MDPQLAEARNPLVPIVAEEIARVAGKGAGDPMALAAEMLEGFTAALGPDGRHQLVATTGRSVADEIKARLAQRRQAAAEAAPTLGAKLLHLNGRGAAVPGYGRPGGLHGGLGRKPS